MEKIYVFRITEAPVCNHLIPVEFTGTIVFGNVNKLMDYFLLTL